MVELIASFSCLKSAKVLIIGDLMLDTYTIGNTHRISPEAPVPILHVEEKKDLPGGAGNVALNLKALGAEVLLVGRIGDDKEGYRLIQLLEKEKVDTSGIFMQNVVCTPVKNRFIANNQHLIRVDQECTTPIDQEVERKVMAFIINHITECKAVAVSDYAKGFLSESLLGFLIDLTAKHNIPSLIDPKGEDFRKYRGATLIKPNYEEACIASRLSSGSDLNAIGRSLVITTNSTVVVTRSEEGMTLFEREGGRRDFPVKSREVKDITGAGDTALAMIAVAMAAKLGLHEGIALSNVAAGIAIKHMGCRSVSLSDIAESLLQTHVCNKIFNASHICLLEWVLQEKKLTILGLNTEVKISHTLFTYIQRFSKNKDHERLMIYLSESTSDAHLASFLASFKEVDFIVMQSDSLTFLSQRIDPYKIYALNKKGLATIDHTLALLQVI